MAYTDFEPNIRIRGNTLVPETKTYAVTTEISRLPSQRRQIPRPQNPGRAGKIVAEFSPPRDRRPQNHFARMRKSRPIPGHAGRVRRHLSARQRRRAGSGRRDALLPLA